MEFGQTLTDGFSMLAFEEDGFANDPFTGLVNYERINTIKEDLPLLTVSDPFIDLLNFHIL